MKTWDSLHRWTTKKSYSININSKSDGNTAAAGHYWTEGQLWKSIRFTGWSNYQSSKSWTLCSTSVIPIFTGCSKGHYESPEDNWKITKSCKDELERIIDEDCGIFGENIHKNLHWKDLLRHKNLNVVEQNTSFQDLMKFRWTVYETILPTCGSRTTRKNITYYQYD